MAVTVHLPSMLRELAGGAAEVTASGDTLGELLDDIATRHPTLERRLRDESGVLRRYVNFYVDGEECRRIGGVRAPVGRSTEVMVIPSVAGG
ncbi:MoaD/ThiS family protein [Haloechinothrix sp. YIM 98757]|uniref:MoaD/ThiS family protein n=1 Tax=Haloechinothrix aidingensis TaxID=2752311 RepID=A0A838AFA1_9PSEU|nr:MoaD/ThiS family protein [Haloechinothrix aidingensis]MBA0127827.1 MoaD/ThiS family protein [Haloechinothrix aidingensis]